MKIAIILHGNLRTFFMPMRENRNERLCDLFCSKIVCPNDPDIFVVTEANDFYYEDVQYCNRLEIVNTDGFRLHTKVAHVATEDGRKIINDALKNFFGDYLKGVLVEEHVADIGDDPKYQILQESGAVGASPPMLVKQWKKVKTAYEMLKDYETKNNVKYDVIIKCRFDLQYYPEFHLDVKTYDFQNIDVYVPGIKTPLVFDWYAFGTRQAMDKYLNIYDTLGFTLNNRPVILSECRRCGKSISEDVLNQPVVHNCPNCKKQDKITHGEVTIASEHHIYKTFKDNNIRFGESGYTVCVYRYRADNDMNHVLNTVDLKGIEIYNHTAEGHMSKFIK